VGISIETPFRMRAMRMLVLWLSDILSERHYNNLIIFIRHQGRKVHKIQEGKKL